VFNQRTEEIFAYFVLVFGEEEFSSVFDKLLHRHNTVVVVVHALESQGGVSLVETKTTEKQFKFVFGDLTRLVFVKGLSKKVFEFFNAWKKLLTRNKYGRNEWALLTRCLSLITWCMSSKNCSTVTGLYGLTGPQRFSHKS
jgi:hypothetical protein